MKKGQVVGSGSRCAFRSFLLGGLTLLVLAFLLPAEVVAMQWNARVSGFVTDPDGKPLEGVKVTIDAVMQRLGAEVAPVELITDEDGQYFARSVRLGDTQIIFQLAGYQEVVERRDLKAGPVRIDMTLKPVEPVPEVARANLLNESYQAGYDAFTAGQFDQAIAHLQEALPMVEQLPENAEAMGALHALIGRSHFELRRFEQARDAFLKWVEYQPDDANSHIELAHAYSELGESEAATKEFQAALARSPDDPMTLYNIGVGMVNAGAAEDGIPFIERAIELQPVYPMAHKNIGYAYAQAGEYAKAVGAFEKYLEQSPEAQDAPEIRDFIVALREIIG
ncbi:MAG TPA: tetratricopeptide repeat protein [Acidobacteriota bacterium]